MADVQSEISRCFSRLLVEEPFYAHLAAQLVRRLSDGVATVAVSIERGRIVLHVNPKFFLRDLRGINQRIAVLKHELLHIVFRHLSRRESSRHDSWLYNTAADIVVNQYVGRWPLPVECVTLEKFAHLEMEPDRTVEWYYKRLVQAHEHSRMPPPTDSTDFTAGPGPGDHSLWRETTDPTGASSSVAEALINRAVAEAHGAALKKGIGDLPGEVRSAIQESVRELKPAVDWRRVMRIFAAGAARTRRRGTNMRESKRYHTRPGTRLRRMWRLLVAVDTSGSLADDDITQFFCEVDSIWRSGASVTVVECDCDIQRYYKYRGEPPLEVHGRGGTAFDPVFELINSGSLGRFDGCIYLTDGFGDSPKIRPRCPLLWAVTQEGCNGDHLSPGRTVVMGKAG